MHDQSTLSRCWGDFISVGVCRSADIPLPALTAFVRNPISWIAAHYTSSVFPFVNLKLHISCAKLHIAESLSNA